MSEEAEIFPRGTKGLNLCDESGKGCGFIVGTVLEHAEVPTKRTLSTATIELLNGEIMKAYVLTADVLSEVEKAA